MVNMIFFHAIPICHNQKKKRKYMKNKPIRLATFAFLHLIFFQTSSVEDMRISSEPFISGDSFRAIANHVLDETGRSFNPGNVKKNDVIFVKTDYVSLFFTTIHPTIQYPYILITHNSDVSPVYLAAHDHPKGKYNFANYLDDPKLIAWFAQNIDYAHPKLIPIPIGIANNCHAHGRVKIFSEATKNLISHDTRSEKIYLNIRVGNNAPERQPVVNYFAGKPFAFFATLKPSAQYLEEMKSYRYVINPPGNGIDCHRTWEALLLGCIPIMKHSILDGMLENLPVIFVHDWHEVTEQYLELKFEELKEKSFNLSKIYFQYWKDLIYSFRKNN